MPFSYYFAIIIKAYKMITTRKLNTVKKKFVPYSGTKKPQQENYLKFEVVMRKTIIWEKPIYFHESAQ
jgi:hypothetical protein